MPAAPDEINNNDQVYWQIGDQHEQIQAYFNLPLLDPSASMERDTLFRLALVTAYQLAEAIPDDAAVEAAMTRKEWKYSLHLSQIHSVITAYSLCKFREAFYSSASALQEYKKLLDYLGKIGLFTRLSEETLEPVVAISTVCKITRFYSLKLAMKSALSCLVAICPDWLRANALPYWYERYKTGPLNYFGSDYGANMEEEAIRHGKDIQHLLSSLDTCSLNRIIDQVEIRELEHLFQGEFTISEGKMTWLNPDCATCTNARRRYARSHSPPL